MIARYGMLECGMNFKGTMSEMCLPCNTVDDENHRLNNCPRFQDINLFNSHEKKDFQNIYSSDHNVVKRIIPIIESVWNTKNSHGAMHK